MRTNIIARYTLGAALFAASGRGRTAAASKPADDKPAAKADDWNEEDDAARRNAAMSGSGSATELPPDGEPQVGIGTALTEGQLAGLDPIDVEKHLDQAAHRADLTNMQTDHEAENALDAVSGTPNPGVTEEQSNAHTQPGARGSDMAGNPPKPNPLESVSREAVNAARSALEHAERQDIANGKRGNEAATRRSAGWRTARDLGVHKATLDALVEAGRVEVETAPGMAHMPETGRLYRIKKDRG